MVKGTLRFGIPDESVTAEQRALFATPQNKDFVLQEVELHDFRTATDVVKGPEGSDVQGFTWLPHRSKIAESDRLFDGRNIEDIYLPELEKYMMEVTGAKKVVVWNGVARRNLPTHVDSNPLVQHKRGSRMDQIFQNLPRDVPFVSGKSLDSSIEPIRNVHIDMNNDGLRKPARFCRHDIRSAGQKALDAEDAGEEAPRYAAYSIWRPLRTITRDPLAACDWRTVDQVNGLYDADYRNPADNEEGEFMNTVRMVLPPKEPVQQKWYYLPDQTPDDILILKIGDTGSDKDPNIACGTPHASPRIRDMDDVKEARVSIEIRVLAFC